MASKLSPDPDVCVDCEPGASSESMLETTDDLEQLEREMRSGAEDRRLAPAPAPPTESTDDLASRLDSQSLDDTSTASDDDYLHNPDWINQQKHIFVLSSAGKPIYSRHGNEDKLVTTYGVMQVLVSYVQVEQDVIRCINAGDKKFVFLVKGPLILVAVSRTTETVPQLILQLTYVYNQITSVLTGVQLSRIFEQRRNYDLRRLLTGAERLMDHLLCFMEREPAFLLGAVKCLPLQPSTRDSISQAITQACSKIKNVVFAILIAGGELVTLVRMKSYYMSPCDLHLLLNLVSCSESFKGAESWTPICLPRFDPQGYLHAHVSYLADDCQACLMLLTVDRDVFFQLSQAKQRIVEKLRRSNCLEAINEAMCRTEETAATCCPELVHFLYKCRSTAQYWSPRAPITPDATRLHEVYGAAHGALHASPRTLKLLHSRTGAHSLLAWATRGFELYALFPATTPVAAATSAVSRLLKWIKQHEDRSNCLEAINEAMCRSEETAATCCPELVHFLYKCRSTAQYWSPRAPNTPDATRLHEVYGVAHGALHATPRTLKLLHSRTGAHSLLAWATRGFELYALFPATTPVAAATSAVSRLLKWIKQHEDRSNCLVNEAMCRSEETAATCCPELVHFLYKCRSTAQYWSPRAPITPDATRLHEVYGVAHGALHATPRTLKLLHSRTGAHSLLAWATRGFELYALFPATTPVAAATSAVSRLLKWIKQHEDRLFILNAPTF